VYGAMQKILLMSDTHGNLDIINKKAAQTNADFVIHAGELEIVGAFESAGKPLVTRFPRNVKFELVSAPQKCFDSVWAIQFVVVHCNHSPYNLDDIC